MTREQFVESLDEVFGVGVSSGAVVGATVPAILIRVNDIPGLVKAKGGAMGELVQKIAPVTIQNKVYEDMASQFSEKLKEQGVSADVSIVNWPQPGATPFVPDNTARNVVLGAGVLGGLGLLYFLFGRSPKVAR